MEIVNSIKDPARIRGFRMSEDEYKQHRDDYNGICTACGAVRFGETEPDATDYPCDQCEDDKVQGIDNLLIDGRIAITEKN